VSQVRYHFACGSKPVSLDTFGGEIMLRRHLSTALLFTCLFATCGQAPKDNVVGKVVEVGVFELGPGEPGTREARFTSHGNVITPRLGSQFGFRFTVKNLPDTATVDLKTYVTHPPFANKEGEVKTRYALLTTIPVKNGTSMSVTGYSFDRSEEMTPGEWPFTHTSQGRTLVTQSFTVVAPKDSQ
jgi:hypothetical protein